MTVRVKNKYLVIAALILVVFVGLGYAAGGDLLFLRAETARRNQDYVKAFANYEALIERYPQHRKVPDALYWSADLLPSQSVFFAKFFPSSSSVSRRTGSIPEPQAGAMTREERYWHIYNDHPKHWSARHVIFRLAEIYRSKDPQMAETLYLQTMEDPRSVNRVEAAQHLIEMYVRTERFQEALEIVHYCQAHLPGHLPADIQMALGDIYAAMGDIESAQAAYEQVIPILEGQFEQFPLYASDEEGALRSVEGTVWHYQDKVEKRLQRLESAQGTGGIVPVEGIVTFDGEPFGGIEIVVREVNREYSTWSYSDVREFVAVTDSQGKFTTQLSTGVYEIGLQLDYSQAKVVEGSHLQVKNGQVVLPLQGELPPVEFRFVKPVQLISPEGDDQYDGVPIEIAWEEYPEAVRYRVSFSGITRDEKGYHSTGGKSFETTDNNLSLDNITFLPFGYVGYDGDGVLPSFIIESPKAFDEIQITVSALGSDGAVLSSSSGLQFSDSSSVPGTFKVPEQELTEAERLLLERRYEEAVVLLEEQIQQDPSDVDSLWMLARIYFSGTRRLTSDGYRDTFAHHDPERSLEMLQRIRELQPSTKVLDAMVPVLRSLGRDGELLQLYTEMINSGDASWDAYNYLANHALYEEDDLSKAFALYAQALETSENYFGFLDYYGLLLLSGRVHDALALLDNSNAWYDWRHVELRYATEALAESGRSNEEEDVHLGTANPSFAKAVEKWAGISGSYSEYLVMVVKLLDPDGSFFGESAETEVKTFIQSYGNSEPELVGLIKALAVYRGLQMTL